MAEVKIVGADQFDLAGPGGPLRVFVWRPPVPPPSGGHPVIYALDGNAHFASLIASVKGHAGRPELTGLDPAVVVGVGYPIDDDYDLDRRILDYTPQAAESDLGVRPHRVPWPPVGGADAFLDFLAGELRDRAEAGLAVDPERRSLFGHSFGGLLTVYTLLTRPGLFRNYLASSPSIWFAERRVLAFLDGFPDRLAAAGRRDLFLSVGELEQMVPDGVNDFWPAYADWIRQNNMVDNARSLRDALGEIPSGLLALAYREIEDEHHGSAPPVAINKAMPVALRRSPP